MTIVCSITGGVLFLAAQMPNRLLTRYRVGGTIAALATAAVGFTVGSDRAVGAVIVFIWLVPISNQWFHEISDDIESRKLEGQERLVRHPGNVVWNPIANIMYRHAMFRDPWSRERLLRMSSFLPFGLDGRHVN